LLSKLQKKKDKGVGYGCPTRLRPWYFRTLQNGVQQATTKYGGLSTAAAKAPPSVEMTWGLWWVEEIRQRRMRNTGVSPRGGKSAAFGQDDVGFVVG
jgi:hypothetical protein